MKVLNNYSKREKKPRDFREQEPAKMTAEAGCLVLTSLMPSGNRKGIIIGWHTSRSAGSERFTQVCVCLYLLLALPATNHTSNISLLCLPCLTLWGWKAWFTQTSPVLRQIKVLLKDKRSFSYYSNSLGMSHMSCWCENTYKGRSCCCEGRALHQQRNISAGTAIRWSWGHADKRSCPCCSPRDSNSTRPLLSEWHLHCTSALLLIRPGIYLLNELWDN